MTYTTVGITHFVLGAETDGNRENRDYQTSKSYDIDPLDGMQAYTADATEFPVV
jgi:hypothetical protein